MYHLGIIPDGNRRWAKINNMHPSEGHKRGAKKMEELLQWSIEQPDLKEISIYALSEENFKRSGSELKWLYDIYYNGLKNLADSPLIHDEKIQVNFVSTKSRPLPSNLIEVFDQVRSETKYYGNKVLNVLIGYTGQTEILQAVNSPMNRIKNLLFGLNEDDIKKHLGVKSNCDFVIRTGEEEKQREAKSGFLLWQSAYSEYYHVNKFFPDLTNDDLNKAWNYFISARRKKGK